MWRETWKQGQGPAQSQQRRRHTDSRGGGWGRPPAESATATCLGQLPPTGLEVGVGSAQPLPPAAREWEWPKPQPSVSAAPPPQAALSTRSQAPRGLGCTIKEAYPRFIAGLRPQGVANASLWTLWSLEKAIRVPGYVGINIRTPSQGRGAKELFRDTALGEARRGAEGPLYREVGLSPTASPPPPDRTHLLPAGAIVPAPIQHTLGRATPG